MSITVPICLQGRCDSVTAISSINGNNAFQVSFTLLAIQNYDMNNLLLYYSFSNVDTTFWVGGSLPGFSWKVHSITSQSDFTINLVLEDVDNYCFTMDNTGIGGAPLTGQNHIFFQLNQDGIPQMVPLYGNYVDNILPQLPADVVSRFVNRSYNSQYIREIQLSHTFSVGDPIIYNSGTSRYELAGNNLTKTLGYVTQIGVPTVNYFNWKPLGEYFSTIPITLPNSPTAGDIYYIDTAGTYTKTQPASNVVPIWYVLPSGAGILLKGTFGSAGAGGSGITGATGTAGGATGETGIQGSTGETGIQGATGETGIQGATGETGIQGSTGQTGIQGATGATGQQGSTGETGIQGTTGETGAHAPTVLFDTSGNASVAYGDLTTTITQSSGLSHVFTQTFAANNGWAFTFDIPTFTATSLQVSPEPILGYHIVLQAGTIYLVATPIGSYVTGDTIQILYSPVVDSNGHNYFIYQNGTLLASETIPVSAYHVELYLSAGSYPQSATISNIQFVGTGTQGSQGVTGSTGSQGTQGITGHTGPQGIQGVTGETGVTGEQGITGHTGSQGIQGTTGETGPQGSTGTTGQFGVGQSSFSITAPSGPVDTIQINSSTFYLPAGTNNQIQSVETFGGQFQGVYGQFAVPSVPSGELAITVYGNSQNYYKFYITSTTTLEVKHNNVIITGAGQDLSTSVGDIISFYFDSVYFYIYRNNVQVWSDIPIIKTYQINHIEPSITTSSDVLLSNFRFYPTGATIRVTGATGDVGSTGATGSAGTRGSTGETGSLGHTGATGSVGHTGETGPVGATGETGNLGHTGETGSVGSTGETGPVGSTGETGPVGHTGETGYLGHTGETGSVGSTGETGPVGSTGETGPVGHTGETGSIGHTGPVGQTGETGPIGSTGETGSVGHTGETGSVGHTGETGPVGQTGETGPVGATGETGSVGHTGETGPVGSTGETGSVGHTGETGSIGHTGETGSVGHTGETGPVGHTGETGSIGHTGETGSVGHTGETGPVGSTGETGPVGHTGETGSLGHTGETGSVGHTGETGPQGSTGETGSLGHTGETGALGHTGETGSVGATGETGPQGIQGTTGETGVIGADIEQYLSLTRTDSTDYESGLTDAFIGATYDDNIPQSGISFNTANGRFTAGMLGSYLINFTLIMDSEVTANDVTFLVQKNSVTIWQYSLRIYGGGIATPTPVPLTLLASLNPGDYINVFFESDAAQNVKVLAGSTMNMSRLSMGPVGPTGYIGATGETGTIGGATGATGSAGGATGETGINGVTGETGSAGGATGETGSPGITGATGPVTAYIFDGGSPSSDYSVGPAFDCGTII